VSGTLILFILVLVSFLPLVSAVPLIRRRKIIMPLPLWLIFLSGGVLSLLIALVLQAFIPQFDVSGGWRPVLTGLVLRIALTEEVARLIVLLIIFRLIKVFSRQTDIAEGFASASGLIAGLAFAAVEYAVYTAENSGELALMLALRLFAIPLHAACGIRCGLAASELFSKPLSAGRRFISAVIIHAFFDIMLGMGGFRAWFGILLAGTALASQIRLIRNKE
jgi:RsiW-degrading membrane proteinase PrsW (M82 family)